MAVTVIFFTSEGKASGNKISKIILFLLAPDETAASIIPLWISEKEASANLAKKAIAAIERGTITYADSAKEALERILTDERRRLLYQALKKLDERTREVLTLQYFCNLSQKEIAALLKLNPENVRVLSYRGKKRLKEYMEENGYEI